jgi:hypothetical protein
MINKTDLIKKDKDIKDLFEIGKHLYERFEIIWVYYKIFYYWKLFKV